MSRRVAEELTAADLTAGELRRAPSTRRWLTVTVVTVLVLAVAAVVYGLTFAPDHYAQWRAALSDGATPVVVAAGAGAGAGVDADADANANANANADAKVSADGMVTVTPETGWVVQPLVADLVSWPPLPPLRDWTVLMGAETGVQVLSPDRQLQVELVAAPTDAAANTAWLMATEQVSGRADADADADAGADADAEQAVAADSVSTEAASAPTVRTETLASGAVLQHVDAAHSMRAVVMLGDKAVRVVARTTGDINVYRPALAQLLESVTHSV